MQYCGLGSSYTGSEDRPRRLLFVYMGVENPLREIVARVQLSGQQHRQLATLVLDEYEVGLLILGSVCFSKEEQSMREVVVGCTYSAISGTKDGSSGETRNSATGHSRLSLKSLMLS